MNARRLVTLFATLALALAGLSILLSILSGSSPSVAQARPLIEPPTLPNTSSVRYVATSGVDTGDCQNPAVPCHTIGYAISQAMGGDTIFVAGGTYTENVVIDRGLALQGGYEPVGWTHNYTLYKTIIDGSLVNSTIQVLNNLTAVVEGFQITRGDPYGVDGDNSAVTIRDSWIVSNVSSGIYFFNSWATPQVENNEIAYNVNGVWCTTSQPIVKRNFIHDNGHGIICDTENYPPATFSSNTISGNSYSGIYLWFASSTISGNLIYNNAQGVICQDWSNPTMYNNLIYSNTGWGIQVNGSSPIIVNNTLAGNGNGGVSLDPGAYSTAVSLTNNIIVANGGYGVYEEDANSDPASLTYNDLYSNLGGNYFDEGTTPYTDSTQINNLSEASDNIVADSLFVDALGADYHLMPTSPCIDAGTGTGAPLTDIDGDPRPLGNGYDIGADEFRPVTSTPGVPVLLAPPSGTVTTTQTITFAWQAGAGDPPDGYNLQLDGGDGNIAVITTTTTTSATLLPVGVYTWTVRAFNAAGYSEWAAPWTVEVTRALSAPGVPALLAPPSGTVTTTHAITFTWHADAGDPPNGYNLQLDSGNGNVTIITTTATTSATLLPVGVYTWTVRAFNDAGYSAWAAPWTVEVEAVHHNIYLPVVLRNG